LPLYGAVAVICTLGIGASAWNLKEAFDEVARARRAIEVAEAARSAFSALQDVRTERGPLRVALRAENAAEVQFLAGIERLRSSANEATDTLMAICSRTDCGRRASGLAAVRERLVAARRNADAAARQPKAQRPARAAEDWITAATEMVDLLEATVSALTGGMRAASPLGAQLAQIKDAAYTARDGAGLERDFLLTGMADRRFTPEARLHIARLRARVEAAWPIALAAADASVPAVVRSAIDEAQEAYFRRFLALRAQVEQAIEAGQAPPISASELNAALDAATSRIVEVAMAAFSAAGDDARTMTQSAYQQVAVAGVLLALMLLLSAGVSLYLYRRVLTPLGAITARIGTMASGDLSSEISGTDRQDEVGRLAHAAQQLRESLTRAAELERMTRLEADAKARRGEAIAVATGELEHDLSLALGALQEAASNVDGAAGRMRGVASAVARVGSGAAEGAHMASGEVQAVAAATEELSASISEISRQVAQSAAVAERAVQEAHATDDTVRGLSEAATRIGDVVQMISSIAGQTNLLALNATIEAARAGDAGKGFAVVAGEVKLLASQTAKATDEIGAQIGSMRAATDKAVAAIQRITEVVGEMHHIGTAIAAAVEEQGAATREIAHNVSRAAQGAEAVTLRVAELDGAGHTADTEAAALVSAAQLLQGQSSRLRVIVDAFFNRLRAA
jgi:methyl-accepting chemotaxis protein